MRVCACVGFQTAITRNPMRTRPCWPQAASRTWRPRSRSWPALTMAPRAEVAGWASSGKRARCSEKTWWLQVVSVSVPVERGYRVSLCRQGWQEWGQRPKPILVPRRSWKPCGPGMPSRFGLFFSRLFASDLQGHGHPGAADSERNRSCVTRLRSYMLLCFHL